MWLLLLWSGPRVECITSQACIGRELTRLQNVAGGGGGGGGGNLIQRPF